MQFVEAGERGIEVCLVELLAAADEVTFDGEHLDHPPISFEALG